MHTGTKRKRKSMLSRIRGQHSFDRALSRRALQVWDLDYGEKSDFLGEIRLSKQDLAENVPVDGTNEFTAVLQQKPGGSDKFNRLVQGSLRFTCQVGGVDGTVDFGVHRYLTASACVSMSRACPRFTGDCVIFLFPLHGVHALVLHGACRRGRGTSTPT